MPVPKDTVQEAKERLALMELMDGQEYYIPRRQIDENLLIATWNIRHFSNRMTWRSLKYIADIIERFDIVAIQEIKSDLRGLSRLQEILPGKYRILISDITGTTERFAFIYDARTVEPTGLVAEIGLSLEKGTHIGFQFHRMPYCASFRAGRFDFTIVTVHIFYSDEDIRQKEIQLLAEGISKLSKKQTSKVFDRDFFILGDFNIEKHGDEFFNALKQKNIVVDPIMENLNTNYQQTKTFDKIAWVDRPDFSFTGNANVVPFGNAVYKDLPVKKRRNIISDHLPVWAEFGINELTQSLSQTINKAKKN